VLIGMRGAVTEMMEAIGLYRGGEQA